MRVAAAREGALAACAPNAQCLPPPPRAQVAQNLARNWADGSWRVASVELHRERCAHARVKERQRERRVRSASLKRCPARAAPLTRRARPPPACARSYEGPFTGRQELGGCGGGHPVISTLPRAAPEAAAARGWAPAGGVVLEAGPDGRLLPSSAAPAGFASAASGGGASSEGEVVTTLLPLGAWSVVRLGEGGSITVEAGALAEGGRRQVAARSYAGGRVARVALGVETAAA